MFSFSVSLGIKEDSKRRTERYTGTRTLCLSPSSTIFCFGGDTNTHQAQRRRLFTYSEFGYYDITVLKKRSPHRSTTTNKTSSYNNHGDPRPHSEACFVTSRLLVIVLDGSKGEEDDE